MAMSDFFEALNRQLDDIDWSEFINIESRELVSFKYTVNILQVSTSEIKKVFAEADAELAWHAKFVKTLEETKRVVPKYKLQVKDIYWHKINKWSEGINPWRPPNEYCAALKSNAKTKTQKDRRTSVAAMFLLPSSEEIGQVEGAHQDGLLIFVLTRIWI